MTVAERLLRDYEQASTWAEAERALDALAGSEEADDVPLGDLYDEVATYATDEGDPALAVRAQRKALEHGCSDPEIGRQMLGWYLMLDEQRVAAEDHFASLLAEPGADEFHLLITLGNARGDAGHVDDALDALERALQAALARDDPLLVDRARNERWAWRQERGLPPDGDDLLASKPHLDVWRDTRLAIAWFGRDERAAALERWPDLSEDLSDADGYCRRIEGDLRELRETTGRTPRIAPLRVNDLVAFADCEALYPGDAGTRSRLASEIARRGETVEWPPGRNDPCWCGSERKYKRCCGAA